MDNQNINEYEPMAEAPSEQELATGFMNESLSDAIDGCLQLNRDRTLKGSQKWSWDNAWHTFRDNLFK